MNEFFKLLRDFVIFIPLCVLIFGILLSLTALTERNLSLLIVGFIIFLYGLVASFLRQIYKDYLEFLKTEKLPGAEYLWKKYHCYYYTAQFLLLGIFVYVFMRFWTTTNITRQFAIITIPSQSVPLFALTPFGWEAISAAVLIVTAVLIWIQAKATKELVENETRPVVDVCIINTPSEGTIIHFLNKRGEIPALVWITIEVFIDDKKVKTQLDSRFIGQEPWPVLHLAYKTACIIELNNLKVEYENKKIELSLETYLAPIFLPIRKSRFHKKSYRFDPKMQKWIDTFWGISDEFVIHPNFKKSNP